MVNVKKYELGIPIKSTNETGPGVAGIKAISKTLDDLQKKLKPLSDKNKVLVNLKPLDPGSIGIVYNAMGRIIRYEQTNRVKKSIKKGIRQGAKQ